MISRRRVALFSVLAMGCAVTTTPRIIARHPAPSAAVAPAVAAPERVATVTLCAPSELGFPTTSPRAVEGVSRVLGIQHERCDASVPWWPADDEARWSDTFYIATDPPVRVACPEPDSGWFGVTRRMIVRERGDAVSLECVAEPFNAPEERVSLGRWEVPLRGRVDATALATGRLADTSTWGADRAPSARVTRAFPSRAECDPTVDDFAFGAPMRVTAGVDAGLLVAAAYTADDRVCAGVLRGPHAFETPFISASALAPAPDAPPVASVDDLVGTWTDESGFDVIVLRREAVREEARCAHGETLRAIGCAWWYGGEGGVDGEIVHLGGFDAEVCAGLPALRVHDDESGCTVVFVSEGNGRLRVRDNEACGGMNVRFSGVFTRRAWRPSSSWQVCPAATARERSNAVAPLPSRRAVRRAP